jgi:hypothetical protein
VDYMLKTMGPSGSLDILTNSLNQLS